MLPMADHLYLTIVHTESEGDAFFPVYDESRWQEREREAHRADERNPYDYTFLTLDRIPA